MSAPPILTPKSTLRATSGSAAAEQLSPALTPGGISSTILRGTTISLVLFCVAHFFVDLYSGSLGVLQPFLIGQFHLSFTQAGLLGGLLSFSSSVAQPLYGYLSDRYPSRLYTALAPAVAGIFISGLGYAAGFPSLIVMVILGGVGIASFHPHATANATVGIVRNRAQAMAIFISAGSLGMALGPSIFSMVTGSAGLKAAPVLAIPGLVCTLALLFYLRPQAAHKTTVKFDLAPLRKVWKPLTILFFLVFLRSVVQVSFTQLLPLYLKTSRGYTLAAASLCLTLYALGGAVGGFAGGSLADRFGGRRVIFSSMLLSVPLLATFLLTHGTLSTICLFLSGLVLLFTNPVNVVMAQRLAPGQTSTVSALMMGFAWGTAGMIFIPLAGWVSDHFSMQIAFNCMLAAPAIGAVLAWKLPHDHN